MIVIPIGLLVFMAWYLALDEITQEAVALAFWVVAFWVGVVWFTFREDDRV